MTARPWGTTGRVRLDRTGSTFTVYEVRAAGCYAGLVIDRGYLRPNSGWSASQAAWRRPDASDREKYDLPSLDAAVMWVIRRAAPDVWRQERGPVPAVWRSRSFAPGKWSTEWRGGLVLVSDTHAEALAAALGPTP